MTDSDVFQIGFGKENITPEPRGEVLMGFGDPKHTADSVAKPLFARAVIFKTESASFALICLEICFITQALRNEVLQRLQSRDPQGAWNEENVLLCATHTHCAPGGHTHDVLYNIPSFGWYPHVFEKYAQGSVDAVLQATRSLTAARVRYSEGEFSIADKVAFNRSIDAWNKNPDVEKHPFEERDRAVDRRMRLFRFEDLSGKFLGCLNEFAVHCTSVHRNHHVIHSDNKGVAAEELESDLGGICIFVQGAAGDVTPNFQRFKGLPEVRGTDRDDLESARKNGSMQAAMARALVIRAESAKPIDAVLDSTVEYVDFSKIHVDPKDVKGRTDCYTGPAVIGARALLGTDEGMPTPKILFYIATLVSRAADLLEFIVTRDRRYLWNRDPVQGVKVGCLQVGESRVFRAEGFENSVVPAFLSPEVSLMKRWAKQKLMSRPLTPQVLPIQALRLGDWVWVSVPSEFTTTSGRRLKNSVLGDLQSDARTAWARNVLLVGYANSYSGYVTTPEEYQAQRYEGASTHFGQWTQPAYQTAFRALLKKFAVAKSSRAIAQVRPPAPTETDLQNLRARPPR